PRPRPRPVNERFSVRLRFVRPAIVTSSGGQDPAIAKTNMARTRYLVSLVWMLGAVGGCADSGPRPGAPIPIEEFPLSFAGAFCEQYLECASARANDYELSLLSLSPSFGALCPTLLVGELGELDELVSRV